MNGYKSTGFIILSILNLIIVTVQTASCTTFNNEVFQPPFPLEYIRNILETYILIKTIITTINLILLLFLLIIYVEIYNKTGSKFSLGLILFIFALILYAVTSNPLLHIFTGFHPLNLGLFTILPDLFTLIASAILLYLSRQ
jgi:hypothetical protein